MKKQYLVTVDYREGDLTGANFRPFDRGGRCYLEIQEYKSPFDMVREFHIAYGHQAPDAAELLPEDFQNLRYKLHDEELLIEYPEAVAEGDLEKIADALCDALYVIVGSAVGHGFVRFMEMFEEVHRSNMSKLGDDGKPIYRDDGKVLKGPNFSLPDLRKFL